MVDDHDIDGRALGFQFQTELFLDGGEERSAGLAILVWGVFQFDVEGATDASTVENRLFQFVSKNAGEEFGAHSSGNQMARPAANFEIVARETQAEASRRLSRF